MNAESPTDSATEPKTYGMGTATGWITDLFPYIVGVVDVNGELKTCRRRNCCFEIERKDWMIPLENGVSPNDLPSGHSDVPVKISFPDGSGKEMRFMAGFFAIRQASSDLSISPVIEWCFAEPGVLPRY